MTRATTWQWFSPDVRAETFRPRDDLWFLFVAIDWVDPKVGPLWFVPSRELASRISPSASSGRLRFAASAKPDSHDQWRPYRYQTIGELTARLLAVLGEL